jgi:hypothetical protein
MVAKWGQITKAEAVREAGYTPKRDNGASELGSKLTNPTKNPHVVRYMEKLRAVEQFKWEKDKLRSYKQFDRMREGAIEKNQFNAAINAEKSIGQMAGFFVNKSEVNVIGLEGMSREQLEKRLDELERNNRPLSQGAIKIYTGSVVRVSGISDNEPPTLVLGPDKFEWQLLDQLLFPASR